MKILFLFFLFLYKYCLNQEVELSILLKDVIISNYTLNITNINQYNRINYVDTIYGKLCYERNYAKYVNNCKIKYEGYNSLWFLLIEDSDYLIELLENINNNKETRVFAIIYNEGLVDKPYISLTRFIPIISSNNETMKKLIRYDVNREGVKYFVRITCKLLVLKTDSIKGLEITIKILFYFNLVALCIFLFVCAYFIQLDKFYQNQPVQIHKSFSIFPYMRVFTALLFCYYNYLLLYLKEYTDKIISQYILIVYLTIQTVYRTFFWFVLLLIAYGWIIYRESVTRENIRKFVLYYIIIYMSLFFDPFLDTAYENQIFYISDIKNILIYCIFTYLIVNESIKTYSKLNDRYQYAYEFLPNYCRSIALKLLMVKSLIILCILYSFLNILAIFSVRTLIPFSNQEILLNTIIKFLDDMSLFNLLYIFRPRVFPPFFDISLDNENIINIYKVYLPSNKKLISDVCFDKNIALENDGHITNKLYIIVNPIELVEGRSRFNIIDKISIASEK